MRRFVLMILIFNLMFGGFSVTAFAADCTQDTLIDKFGDWFGNLGKKEKTRERNIAKRKANRIADCAEKQAKEAKKGIR